MTNAELLIEVKRGLNIPIISTNFDGVLTQKVLAVKGYMSGAGVSNELTDSDLGTGLIVMGVADLWNIQSGDARLSKAFHTILAQMAVASQGNT